MAGDYLNVIYNLVKHISSIDIANTFGEVRLYLDIHVNTCALIIHFQVFEDTG